MITLPLDLAAELRRLDGSHDLAERVARGRILTILTRYQEAREVLAPAVEELATDAPRELQLEARLALGVAQQLSGATGDAEASYRAAIERDPREARGPWELGTYLADLVMVDQAAALWDAAGEPGWAARARAWVAGQRGDHATARDGYLVAIDQLVAALGGEHALLGDVLAELVAEHVALGEQDDAAAIRVRTVALLRASCGPGSLRHAEALYQIRLVDPDDGDTRFDAALAEVAGDPLAEAILLYARGSARPPSETPAMLRLHEASLIRREVALGIESLELPHLRDEISRGWQDCKREDEAEAFLHRCRDRAPLAGVAYRNLTYAIGYLLANTERRDEYAALWRDFVARRTAECSEEASREAVEIAAAQLPYYAPPAEVIALAERAVRAHESTATLRVLARAHAAADDEPAQIATYRRVIDCWIAELAPGKPFEYEWTIAACAALMPSVPRGDHDFWGNPIPVPAQGAAIFDDALARAIAVVGPDAPDLAKLYLDRGNLFVQRRYREVDGVADLHRARELFTAKGDLEGVADAARGLAEHFAQGYERDEAETWVRRAIEVRPSAIARRDDRERLAALLLDRGDAAHVAEAIATLEALIAEYAADAPGNVPYARMRLVRAHLAAADVAGALAVARALSAELATIDEYAQPHVVESWWALAKHCIGHAPDTIPIIVDALDATWPYPQAGRWLEVTIRSNRYGDERSVADTIRARIVSHIAALVGPPSPLELQLRDSPDATELYLVLADELATRGDPRGELITVQHRRLTSPDDPALKKREDELLEHHGLRLLGPLEARRATWHLGYLRAAAIELDVADAGLLVELLEHRSMLVARELRLRVGGADVLGVLTAHADTLRAIAVVGIDGLLEDQLATLRALVPQVTAIDWWATST